MRCVVETSGVRWTTKCHGVQMRNLEHQLSRQADQLEETFTKLRLTSDELWRARILMEKLQLRNQELERTVGLQRAGSCQNVCCKALDFSRIPLRDVPSMMCEAGGSNPIDIMIEQMCLSN